MRDDDFGLGKGRVREKGLTFRLEHGIVCLRSLLPTSLGKVRV